MRLAESAKTEPSEVSDFRAYSDPSVCMFQLAHCCDDPWCDTVWGLWKADQDLRHSRSHETHPRAQAVDSPRFLIDGVMAWLLGLCVA